MSRLFRIGILVLGGVAALWLGVSTAFQASLPPPPAAPGVLAPALELPAVRGGSFSLDEQRGRVVLLAFLATTGGAGAEQSRSQLVFLKSMQAQYGQAGLVVVGVAIEGLAVDAPALVNATYDLDLPFPLLGQAHNRSVVRAYGVSTAPTTLLIDPTGVITHRWDDFVGPAELDLALNAAFGKPLLVAP